MSVLFVVEDAFPARAGGVHVMPRFTTAQAGKGRVRVRLRLPSGAERELDGEVETAHMRGPLPSYAMLRLLGVTPEDVPIGTEIRLVV